MASEKSDTPQSQPGWEREEQILLTVEYFAYKNDRYLSAKSDVFLSELLRKRAQLLGRDVGAKFRNVHGVQAQRENLSHCDPDSGSEISGHESNWMYKTVNEYLANPQKMIMEAYEIIKKYV